MPGGTLEVNCCFRKFVGLEIPGLIRHAETAKAMRTPLHAGGLLNQPQRTVALLRYWLEQSDETARLEDLLG